MKNNIDYYRHESSSHQHPKFKMLRVKYGWEGEGKFWALNNMIAQAENCKLDLSQDYVRSTIAYDLAFTLEEFDEFITYLSDKCKLIKRNSNKITTDITQETLTHLYTKRLRNKSDYEKKTQESNPSDNIQNAEIKIQSSENIQSKVKESKVKKDTSPERVKPVSEQAYLTRVETFFSSLSEKTLSEWCTAYPHLDVRNEIIKAQTWLKANTHKRKSRFNSFMVNWLNRAIGTKQSQSKIGRSNLI